MVLMLELAHPKVAQPNLGAFRPPVCHGAYTRIYEYIPVQYMIYIKYIFQELGILTNRRWNNVKEMIKRDNILNNKAIHKKLTV